MTTDAGRLGEAKTRFGPARVEAKSPAPNAGPVSRQHPTAVMGFLEHSGGVPSHCSAHEALSPGAELTSTDMRVSTQFKGQESREVPGVGASHICPRAPTLSPSGRR